VLGVVVVATAGAAFAAHKVYRQPATAPPVVTAGESSVPPAAEPGSSTVTMTPDVAASPDGGEVRQLMQVFFDAINTHSYKEWKTVVTPERIAEQNEEMFNDAYASTKDGTIQVRRIEAAPDGDMSVLVTFHSMQDIAHAPSYAPYPCVQWQVVWPVVRDSTGQLKVDAGMTGKSPQAQQCG
jgi:hypothetical protein